MGSENEDTGMQTQIVARVAEYIRSPEARKSIEKSAVSTEPKDRVELSAASKVKSGELAKTNSEWERARMERVTQVTEQVQTKTYKMAPEMVDAIAQRIVAVL